MARFGLSPSLSPLKRGKGPNTLNYCLMYHFGMYQISAQALELYVIFAVFFTALVGLITWGMHINDE